MSQSNRKQTLNSVPLTKGRTQIIPNENIKHRKGESSTTSITTASIKLLTKWHGHFFVLGEYYLPLQKGKIRNWALVFLLTVQIMWYEIANLHKALNCTAWSGFSVKCPTQPWVFKPLVLGWQCCLARVSSIIGRSSLEKVSHWGHLENGAQLHF